MRWLLSALLLSGCWCDYVLPEQRYDQLASLEKRQLPFVAVEAERVNGPSALVRGDGFALHWPGRGKRRPGPQRVKVLNVYYTLGFPLLLLGGLGTGAALGLMQVLGRAGMFSLLAVSLANGVVGGTLVLYGRSHRPYEVDAPEVERVIR